MPAVATHRENAYHFIRGQIADGTLAPGGRVSELDLAAGMGVSRTPVREAISRLESEGLVEQVPRFGAFVRRLTRDQIKDLYDLRILLEGHAAKEATGKITPDELDQLDAICRRMHQMARRQRDAGETGMDAQTAREWIGLDVKFHMLIVHASDNRLIAKTVADFRIMTNLCGEKRAHPDKSFGYVQATTWRDHLRIYRALRRGDAQQSCHAMSHHIELARIGALSHYDQLERESAPKETAWPDSVPAMIARMERYRNGAAKDSDRSM